jgi:hypothetical protein
MKMRSKEIIFEEPAPVLDLKAIVQRALPWIEHDVREFDER